MLLYYVYMYKLNKSQKIICCVFVGLFSISAYSKIVEIKDWTSTASLGNSQIAVAGEVKNDKGIFVLPINVDVITLSKKNDLSDIRIIDSQRNEIPYILAKAKKEVEPERNIINPTILENTLTKEGKRILVIDAGREGLNYTKLHLLYNAESKNFRKLAKVFISDNSLKSNSTAWRELELKSIVYNYTGEDNLVVENSNVNLPAISSRYLKIELSDMEAPTSIMIDGAEIEYSQQQETAVRHNVADYISGNFAFNTLSIFKDVKVQDKTQKDRVSEIIYAGGIDVEELIISIDEDEKNFNRKVELQGSNDDTTWVPLITSSVYRIDSSVYTGEKLNIQIPPSTYKKFKVIIFNGENEPLDVLRAGKVKLQNVGVVFAYEGNVSDLRIIVGNNKEEAPIYDTSYLAKDSQSAIPEIIEYKNLAKNPEYVADIIPFSERKKIWLNVGLLLFVIIIGILGFFFMKHKDPHHHE